MTYRVADLVPGGTATFDPGTSLLVTGPTRVARGRLFDVVAAGPKNGESAIVVSADQSGSEVVAALREWNALVPEQVGIVDCTESGGSEGVADARVSRLSSPGDLTGISLEFAKLLRELQQRGHADRVRVGVASISTLLMYSELQTVFRFLHVFTSRIRSADMLGAFSLDPDMHDGRTRNTVRAIFDCEATVDGNDVALQGSGYAVE